MDQHDGQPGNSSHRRDYLHVAALSSGDRFLSPDSVIGMLGAAAGTPLILYFCVKVMQGQRRAIVGLAVAYALMILSHVVSVFMFSLIPLLMAGLLSAKGQRVKACLMIAGGMALGTGLSCFYFLPALYHSRYFPVSRLFISVKDNLLHLGRGLAQSQGFIRIVSVTVLETIVIIAFCAFMGYRGALPDQKRYIVFWTTYLRGSGIAYVSPKRGHLAETSFSVQRRPVSMATQYCVMHRRAADRGHISFASLLASNIISLRVAGDCGVGRGDLDSLVRKRLEGLQFETYGVSN